MRLIIGMFIAWCAAVIAYDLGLRLPLDAGMQIIIVAALGLLLWPIVSSFSHDKPAHHRH